MFASSNLFNHTSNEMGYFFTFFLPILYGFCAYFLVSFLLGKRLAGKSWCFSFPAFILRHFDPHNFSEVLSWQLVFGIPGVQHMPFSKGILSGEYSHKFVCVSA